MKRFNFFIIMALFMTSNLWGKSMPRSFLIALPLTVGSPFSVAYNYDGQAAISLDITGESEHEMLGKKEQDQYPGSTLLAKSQEIGLTFSRYSNPENMSGWHWGLGAGYKTMSASWIKEPDSESKEAILDQNGNTKHHLQIAGTTGTGRLGYRYVANELGFAASLFLLVKHFQNRIQDQEEDKNSFSTTSPIAVKDAQALRRRLTTTIRPGIEIGWAF